MSNDDTMIWVYALIVFLASLIFAAVMIWFLSGKWGDVNALPKVHLQAVPVALVITGLWWGLSKYMGAF